MENKKQGLLEEILDEMNVLIKHGSCNKCIFCGKEAVDGIVYKLEIYHASCLKKAVIKNE